MLVVNQNPDSAGKRTAKRKSHIVFFLCVFFFFSSAIQSKWEQGCSSTPAETASSS